MNFGQYVAANVSSLRVFREESMNFQIGINALKALSSVMFLLLRYLKLFIKFDHSPSIPNTPAHRQTNTYKKGKEEEEEETLPFCFWDLGELLPFCFWYLGELL